MIPSLEELRRRLLAAPTPASKPETVFQRHPRVLTTPGRPDSPLLADACETTEYGSEPAHERPAAQHSLDGESPPFESVSAEFVACESESEGQLALAVANLFAPVRQYQDRLAQISRPSESVNQMMRAVGGLLDPLSGFRDQMRGLLTSFEPMCKFRSELGTLAQSFEPMKEVEGQMAQVAEAFALNLSLLSKSLEPARALHARLAKLAQTFQIADELQAQFHRLSEAFNAAG